MDPSIRAQFSPRDGLAYLDTATYGLPPDATVRALQQALDQWQAGTARWIDDWDRPAEAARASFAQLVGAGADQVVLLPALSVGIGMVAERLGAGDEVVVPDDEFTSVLFPVLVATERGATVREVPFTRLADQIRTSTTLVAFSLVQMQTGKKADLERILAAAEAVGARTLIDVTQATPFVPLDSVIGRIDYVVAAAYKHLLCPRGVAFLVVRRDRFDDLRPTAANWRAADDPYGRYFGGPLTLASDARRYDVSLPWHPWVGAVESLRLLNEWQPTGAFDEVLGMAEDLAVRLGQPWEGASLVCAPLSDAEAARAALGDAGIRASVRGTAIRLSLHVYNEPAHLDRAVDALRPFLV
jgi:selenocysteine lyase/cysteine desulfurase